MNKELENEVREFWEKNKIYAKVKEKNQKGKKFFFMDGPPYATGNIHMGTALNKITKDIFMRFKRLEGHNVFDRPGYDTHGVPIEFKVEKEIGSKSKKDIEKYGVDKFIKKCKEFATKYIDEMNSEFQDLGIWMEWNNPYLTLQNEYIEAVWDILKKASEKKLLFLDKYSLHVCPRCETAVAYNEIEYEKKEDNAIFVKFPVKGEKNKYLVIWTTTPWTLPANVGIMVNPSFIYQEVEGKKGERWIVAKDLVEKLMSKLKVDAKVLKEYPGEELEGLEYTNPLEKHTKIKVKNGHKVVLSGRYVTAEDGSGLVHCAPGHGKEDYEVGKENGLDLICPVKMDGTFTEEAGKYADKKAKETDGEIIEDLEKDGFLVFKEKYKHDYPVCWRCKTSLLMLAVPQWFLKISEIHSKLLEENEKTNWMPKWAKSRMKAWLSGISDWPISRERYWGTPLPIWECNKCEEKKVVGSIKELEKLSGVKIKDLHKPEIDKVKMKCSCGGQMSRINSVLDVWFDSGVSSFAVLGYPSNKEQFKKFWPADLNIEGPDQFRGWWNSQLILSVAGFDKKPFENVLVHGLVLDISKRKMSKSVGNVVAPKDIIARHSRDHLRYYFARISRGEDISFNENDFKEVGNVFRVLLNVNNFINQLNPVKAKLEIEDKWILSKFNTMIKEYTQSFEELKVYESISKLEKFLLEDLSRTYIQIIRERADETFEVLNEIRIGLLKLLAPITPYLTEKIWMNLSKDKHVSEKSVHLADWPVSKKSKIDGDLENNFETARNIIEKGLAERDLSKMGLRWPLAEAIVFGTKLDEDFDEILKKQLNVKKIVYKKGEEIKVKLDLEMTRELEEEGFSRELARNVQSFRKEHGLTKDQKIELYLNSDKDTLSMFENNEVFLKQRTNSKSIEYAVPSSIKLVKEIKIKDRIIQAGLLISK